MPRRRAVRMLSGVRAGPGSLAYGERGRPRPPVVDLADRRALEAFRPADPETVARARRLVHQILANAELSQLRRDRAVVVRLVALLPAKLRATYLVGASERQQWYWMEVFRQMRGG